MFKSHDAPTKLESFFNKKSGPKANDPLSKGDTLTDVTGEMSKHFQEHREKAKLGDLQKSSGSICGIVQLGAQCKSIEAAGKSNNGSAPEEVDGGDDDRQCEEGCLS